MASIKKVDKPIVTKGPTSNDRWTITLNYALHFEDLDIALGKLASKWWDGARLKESGEDDVLSGWHSPEKRPHPWRTRPMRFGALLAVALLLVAGCTSKPSPAAKSGIEGKVMVGPSCGGPVRDPPDPNCADRPLKTDLVVTMADSQDVVKSFSSDENGTFHVALEPGTYVIRKPAGGAILPRCGPTAPIVVRADSFTKVTVDCDSGIR